MAKSAGEASSLANAARLRGQLEGDRQPHQSVDWLNRHDEDVDAKAPTLGQRYVHALESYEQGRLVRGCEAKTGRVKGEPV